MLPGDMLAFNGLVAGTRGACLVLTVEKIPYKRWESNVVLLGQHKLFHVKLDEREEDLTWWYISEKPWP